AEAGRAWLARLPDLVRECAKRWGLELEKPFEYAFASLAVPAGDVVLKIQFPDRESEHEADALRVWDGEGAVRLLDHDPERHALLLERARPGTSLAKVPRNEALDVVANLLPRLWKLAGAPFRPLAPRRAPPARPTDVRARSRSRPRAPVGAGSDHRLGRRPPGPRRDGALAARSIVMNLRAVLFDVDFTLVRPGPELGPEGYRR